MDIQPWHIPVLIMTAVVLPPAVHRLWLWVQQQVNPTPVVARHKDGPTLLRTRTITLAVLTAVLVALGIVSVLLVPAAVNVIAAVAGALSAVVSAALTVVSFVSLQDNRRERAERDRERGAERSR